VSNRSKAAFYSITSAEPSIFGWLFRREGDIYRWAANYGHSKEEAGGLLGS
jgi:hypothetical protein